jgi:hypothetical protein
MPQQAVWRGLLEGFLQLVSVFIEASQNFIFYFLYNKAAKKFKICQHIYRKYWFDFEDLQKNYSSRDTIPLKPYLI